MTQRIRKQIFYTLVTLFFIVGAPVVLYSQGWRFDIETWQANKVGGIFVQSSPDDAKIELDGRPIENKSMFFSRGTLISNLFPKTYKLSLTKDGYNAWHETAAVSPSLVAGFKYAVLVPQNATTVAVGPVQNFFIANHGLLTIQDENGLISFNKASIKNGLLIDKNSDGNAIIEKNLITGKYLLYKSQSSSTIDLTAILVKSGMAKNDSLDIFFDPHDSWNIIAANSSRIWNIDIVTTKATLVRKMVIGKTHSTIIATSPSTIAWTESKNLEPSSTITTYDKSSEKIIASTTLPGNNIEIQWIKDNTFGFLQNDGRLYLYDADSQTIKKIADDVRNFVASGDGSSVVTLENRSMEIIPLSDISDDNYYRFNLPDIASIQKVSWYKDNMHLFLEYSDHVSFLDVKDSGLNNVTIIGRGTTPRYDANNNTLYLIDPAKSLIRFDFPG